MSWVITERQHALLNAASDWISAEAMCAATGYDGRGRHGSAAYSIQVLSNYGLLDWDPRNNKFRCTPRGLEAVRHFNELERRRLRRRRNQQAEQRAIANA